MSRREAEPVDRSGEVRLSELQAEPAEVEAAGWPVLRHWTGEAATTAEAAAAIRSERERLGAEANAANAERLAAQQAWLRTRNDTYHEAYAAEARRPETRHLSRWVDPAAARDRCRAAGIEALLRWEKKNNPVRLGFPESIRTRADVDTSRWAVLADANVGWQSRAFPCSRSGSPRRRRRRMSAGGRGRPHRRHLDPSDGPPRPSKCD